MVIFAQVNHICVCNTPPDFYSKREFPPDIIQNDVCLSKDSRESQKEKGKDLVGCRAFEQSCGGDHVCVKAFVATAEQEGHTTTSFPATVLGRL